MCLNDKLHHNKETEKFNKIVSSHNQEIKRGKIKTEYVEDGLGLHIRE